MRQNNDRLNFVLYVAAIGLLIAAVVLGVRSHSSSRAIGVVLIAVGAGVIAFARSLTLKRRQQEFNPVITSHVKEVLPTVLLLWGMGGVILGILQALRWV